MGIIGPLKPLTVYSSSFINMDHNTIRFYKLVILIILFFSSSKLYTSIGICGFQCEGQPGQECLLCIERSALHWAAKSALIGKRVRGKL